MGHLPQNQHATAAVVKMLNAARMVLPELESLPDASRTVLQDRVEAALLEALRQVQNPCEIVRVDDE